MCHYSPEGQKETHSCTGAEGISELVQPSGCRMFDTLEAALLKSLKHHLFPLSEL